MNRLQWIHDWQYRTFVIAVYLVYRWYRSVRCFVYHIHSSYNPERFFFVYLQRKLNVCLYPFHRTPRFPSSTLLGSVYSQMRVNEPRDTISCAKSRGLYPSSCFSPEAAASSPFQVPRTRSREYARSGISSFFGKQAGSFAGFASPMWKR